MKPVRVLLLYALALALQAAPALAKDKPLGPDGLPQTKPDHPWVVTPGVPLVDTLSFSPHDIIPAACRQFGEDGWQIYSMNEKRGEIVTMWKQMHHPLIRILMGRINARCTVTLTRLGPSRTRLMFQGDLSAHHPLEHNMMFGAAKREYAKAARNYTDEVNEYLVSHRRLSSIGP
jgi:hypothetical protein